MRTKASRHSHILVPDGLTARLMRTAHIRPWAPVGNAPTNLFIPSGSSGFITSDGDTFTVGGE